MKIFKSIRVLFNESVIIGVIPGIVVLLLMTSPALSAIEGPEPKQSSRPKIGVVFGGGGAKGAAHIGVLKVLEEQ